MKVLGLLSFLIFAAKSFAKDHNMPLCDSFAAQAVACYEQGNLASSYDETGLDCGDQEEELSIWTIDASENETISTVVLEARSYEYAGGKATESSCLVVFKNDKNNICSFHMTSDIGSEDGDLKIEDLSCSY